MILLTGATGFLGEFVLTELLQSGYEVTCFVRSTSERYFLTEHDVPYVFGDLDDYQSLCEALKGKAGLINIASLGFGHAPNIVNACVEMNVNRTVFISTTGIFTNLSPSSKSIREEAERLIEQSGLDYTIIRPTMIYGTKRDRNMWRLIQYLKKIRVMPILGNGEYLQQPVYVKDLAWAIARAYETPKSIKKAYNISGASPLTFNEVVDITGEVLGIKVHKIHLPARLSYQIVKLYEKLSRSPKLKAEQVLRINEDKAFSHEEAIMDFGYHPLTFEEGIRKEILS